MADTAQSSEAAVARGQGRSHTIDFNDELPEAGGGVQAFRVVDRRTAGAGLMALAVRPDLPMRVSAINLLLGQPIVGMVFPLGIQVATRPNGGQGWFVVCPTPVGRPLWLPPYAPITPWKEADLLELVLRPAALTLDQLHARHLTHRSIRPNNLFRANQDSRERVVLGAAWAAPPAADQPAIFEPPYMACCLPGGRGDGSIADDVYALGVTLVSLALGRLPLAGLPPEEIIRRKLEMGSFAALVGEDRLPPAIADLVRGMLAEDPEHRPAPALLADPMAARARRVAARPSQRAQRPLQVGARAVWTARGVAQALSEDHDQAVRLLRGGEVERWLRRSLGDAALATRLEEMTRVRAEPGGRSQPADAMLTMGAIAVLDPLAPLSWRGVMLWPDAIGPALAAIDPHAPAAGGEPIEQMLACEAIATWALLRAERCDQARLRSLSQQLRHVLQQRGWDGGLRRLYYDRNPMVPCRSTLLVGRFVVRLPELLPTLDAVAAHDQGRDAVLIDREIAAFIAARLELRADKTLAQLAEAKDNHTVALAQLRLLAGLQMQQNAAPVPALAAVLARHVAPALKVWRNRTRAARMKAALTELTAAGRLAPMLAVLEDPATLAVDAAESLRARGRLAGIEARIQAIAGGAARRRDSARRIGQEILTSLGAVALTVAVVAAWLG